MPVVQNLARPTAGQLAACRASVDEMDRLCSFLMLPDADYLDLNWAPAALERLGELTPLPPGLATAITRALSQDNEVNPAYRERTDTIFGHPVSALESDEVSAVAEVLASVDLHDLIARFPRDPDGVAARLGLEAGMRDPTGFVSEHLTALRDSYVGARDRGLAMVLWWD